MAFKKDCYYRTNAIPDDYCSNNVPCLKVFCMSNPLYITLTTLTIRMKPDIHDIVAIKTKKANKNGLVEKCVQQNVKEGIAKPNIDLRRVEDQNET